MTLRTPLFLLTLLLGVSISLHASAPQGPPPPMAAGADPTYDVATIKPTTPDTPKHTWVEGTRLSIADASLTDLMLFAYSVHPAQIVGGPDWLRTTKFDVLVQPNLPGRASTPQMRSVLRKLLAARFQLTFHHAQRTLPVYSIVLAKGGPKLTPTTKESAAVNTATIGYRDGTMLVSNASMPEIASLMQRYMATDRPIVDRTGLTGKYDFILHWTPGITQPGSQSSSTPQAAAPAPNSADAPPGFFTAIQEQLGLKLEAAKEPVDVLVIDQAQLPSAN